MTEPPATSALLWEFGNQFEKFGLRSSPDGSGTHEATSLGGDDRDTLGGCQTSRPWPSLCRAPRRAFHGTSSFTGVTEELWRVAGTQPSASPCPRAASRHDAAEPPSAASNSRRLTLDPTTVIARCSGWGDSSPKPAGVIARRQNHQHTVMNVGHQLIGIGGSATSAEVFGKR